MMVDTVMQLFQGGLIAVAEKHKNVRTLTVRCPIIVTTNVLPDFGQHQDAVQKKNVHLLDKVDVRSKGWTTLMVQKKCNALYCIYDRKT